MGLTLIHYDRWAHRGPLTAASETPEFFSFFMVSSFMLVMILDHIVKFLVSFHSTYYKQLQTSQNMVIILSPVPKVIQTKSGQPRKKIVYARERQYDGLIDENYVFLFSNKSIEQIKKLNSDEFY